MAIELTPAERELADELDALGKPFRAAGYFDRDGDPITMGEWSVLFGRPEYKRVALTETDVYTVSTVWLGLNHNWDHSGPPKIFETMVFHSDGRSGDDMEMDRYGTLERALAGHEWTVQRLESGAHIDEAIENALTSFEAQELRQPPEAPER